LVEIILELHSWIADEKSQYLFCPFCPFFVASSVSATENQQQTPSWVNICGGTYLFSEDIKTWEDAKGNCELFGAHIVQIDNIAENFCLLDHAHTMGYSTSYWQSANDNVVEGVWRQWDGTLLSWSPWWGAYSLHPETTEPSGGEAENCAEVFFGPGIYAGKWDNAPCSAQVHYICERGF